MGKRLLPALVLLLLTSSARAGQPMTARGRLERMAETLTGMPAASYERSAYLDNEWSGTTPLVDTRVEGYRSRGKDYLRGMAMLPVKLGGMALAGGFELARAVPTGAVLGVRDTFRGHPLALFTRVLKAACNMVWNAVTLPFAMLNVAVDPIWRLFPEQGAEVKYYPHKQDGHLVVEGGPIGTVLGACGVSAWTPSNLNIFSDGDIGGVFGHEHVHTQQFRDSYVVDFLTKYSVEAVRYGYEGISFEQQAYDHPYVKHS